jgi:hypothetical protein
MRNAYIILKGNPKGRKYFGDLVAEKRMMLTFM